MRIAIPTVRRPQRKQKTVRRARLLDLIHQNIQRKLTFLCAPAGYGKTTLLIDFTEDADARVAWCRMGPEDQDLAYFFQHLILALRQAYPNFGKSLEAISFLESAPSPRALAIELVNEISASAGDFTLLVLDDYHVICEELTDVAFVEQFLELLPDNLRILIGSRSIYGIPTATLYVNEELTLLGMEDLRFRVEEVKDLARRQFRLHLADGQAEEITSQSEGWITSILLIMRDWKPSIVLPKLAGAREQVYQYLTQEVYARLPEETQRFLSVTALCDQFNVPMANQVLGTDHAQRTIQELENNNLFLFSTTNGKETNYQYHQLFRDFLLTKFGEKASPEQAEVHRRIAGWYEQQGEPILSVQHYLLAGERQQAAGIMDTQARPLYVRGEEKTLEDWYQALSGSPDLRRLAPDLVLNRVKVRVNQGKMEGCLELLDLAEPVFIEQDRFENQANLMVVRGMILRFQGDYERAIEISRSTEALVEEHGLDRYYAYQAKRLEGLGLFHTGHQKGASLAFEAAQRGFRELIAQEPTDRLKHDLIQVLTDTGMMSLITGDMFHAQGSFEEALSISLTLRGNKGDLANCANNRAYLAFLMGDYRKAWQTYEQALAAAEQADWTRSLVQVLNGQAELLTLVGEFKMAATTLRRAAEVAQSVQGGQVSPATYREMAELEKLGGNFTQAMYDLREAAHASNADEHDPETQIRFGGVHVSMEQWQAAREELEPALHKLEEGKKPSQLFSLGSYILAEACFQLGEREEAVSHLQKALHEAARLGYDTFLVEAVHRSPGFLQEVEKHWKNRHLHTILQRAGEIPAGIAQLLPTEIVPEEEKPYALQVRALGEPEIRRNGEILPQTNWQSARTRALFFFLLDRRKAKREEIAVEFWPEFSNAKVNSNFHATLWRVRNALGNKNIIAFDGQSYSIQERAVIFYDVHEFEGLLAQSRRRGLTEVERKAIFTQAIDLYCGDFLPDMDLPWIDMRRAELREKYLSLLEQSAADEFENRHFEEARWLYEKAIEIDPYQDLLHLGVMKCLVQLRRPASAKVHFEKYRQNLLAELGSEPMPELREFVEEI